MGRAEGHSSYWGSCHSLLTTIVIVIQDIRDEWVSEWVSVSLVVGSWHGCTSQLSFITFRLRTGTSEVHGRQSIEKSFCHSSSCQDGKSEQQTIVNSHLLTPSLPHSHQNKQQTDLGWLWSAWLESVRQKNRPAREITIPEIFMVTIPNGHIIFFSLGFYFFACFFNGLFFSSLSHLTSLITRALAHSLTLSHSLILHCLIQRGLHYMYSISHHWRSVSNHSTRVHWVCGGVECTVVPIV
jgi:hypothetical protein